MAELKNRHLLKDLDPDTLAKIDHAVSQHKQFGSLSFKIVEYDIKSVIIQVIQEKNASGAYHDRKRLIEIVHETFDRFFAGKKVKVHATPYTPAVPSIVDAAWVNAQMLKTKTKLKEISADTGLNYSYLSDMTNGNTPMSQVTQAMFYYYFLAKK